MVSQVFMPSQKQTTVQINWAGLEIQMHKEGLIQSAVHMGDALKWKGGSGERCFIHTN